MITLSIGVFIGIGLGYLWGYSDCLKGVREEIKKWVVFYLTGRCTKAIEQFYKLF